MPAKIVTLLFVSLLIFEAKAQSESSNEYKNFPLIITLQFHAFAVPFRDFRSNFKNVGIGLGTEVSFNGKDKGVQQFNLVWYRNKNIGNGLLFYTQSAWRPTIVDEFYSELKLGAGLLYSYRPVNSWKQMNGEWVSVGNKGKMMFTVPVGVSLGYHNYSNQVSPFISYQFLAVKGYNQSIPVVPETLVQVGSRIHVN